MKMTYDLQDANPVSMFISKSSINWFIGRTIESPSLTERAPFAQKSFCKSITIRADT